jgi:hypothetical protein
MLEAKLRFVPRNSLWLPNSDSANSLHLNPVLSQLIFCLLLVDKSQVWICWRREVGVSS